ncbi:hypothetical protein ACQ4PT_043246 [Festuca glaucescens]
MGSRRPVRVSSYSLLVSLILLLFADTDARTMAPLVRVRVGVILSSRASSGMERAAIELAFEDYYAAHPRSTTRVELHFRDSTGDVLGAASAAVDLMANAQVQALIGPQTSAEAEFVAHLGNRAHVPVLSYSATSPSLSPLHSPFFVRTAAADSFQASPVAAVIVAFGWRVAAVVHEDSPYGVGILAPLADALGGAAAITERAALPSNAADDALDAALWRLMAMPTRVFVVHATYRLAARLFRRAREAGMMSEGYAWLATDGVGGFLDRLRAEDVDAMQGVVTLRPHIEFTKGARDMSARFRARFRRDNLDDQLCDPTVLRAYDTAWVIAAAAESAFQSPPRNRMARPTQEPTATKTGLDRISVSARGAAFLRAVLHTTFDGMAGRFKLVEGQLPVAAYEVVNIIGTGARTVGFWTPLSGISPELHYSRGGDGKAKTQVELKHIIWPGGTVSTPRDWTAAAGQQRNGRVLRVAVPVKHGFKQFVTVAEGGSSTASANVTGYCIDLFDEVMRNLAYPVSYRYVPFHSSTYSYDKLVELVWEKKADMVVGDVTITAGRMEHVDFTMPFTESGWSMLVAVHKETSASSMWIFLRPLTASLWIASLVFFCFTGFVVWAIEHRINPEFRGTPFQQFGLTFYFAFSTVVFSHKERLESNLSRLVVTIWVFVVLILTSSYTASLTSMLTVEQLQPTVTDVRDLQSHGHYIGYQEGSFIEPLLKKMGFHERRMKKYSSEEQYADALSKGSANGGVAAVFDEIPYLKLFLSRYCDGYAMVGPVYKTDGFGFVFPRGSPMVADVSREILILAEKEKTGQIDKAWFGEPGGACRTSSGGVVPPSNLGFHSFGGLFLITGVVSSLMLLLYFATFVYREIDELRQAPATGSRLRAWFRHYNKKECNYPTFTTWTDTATNFATDALGPTTTTSFSVRMASVLNTAGSSSPEEVLTTPASEITTEATFEQRVEGAAAHSVV